MQRISTVTYIFVYISIWHVYNFMTNKRDRESIHIIYIISMILEATLLSLEKWQYNMIVRSSNSSSGNSSSSSVVAVVVVGGGGVVGVVVVVDFLRGFVNKNRVYIHTYIYICDVYQVYI